MVGLDFGNGAVEEAPAVTPNLTSGVATPGANTPVLSETSHQAFGNALAYGLPGIGAGLIDTLGQSLHLFKNDTIPKALTNFTGQDQGTFGDFYTRNQAAMRGAGEIAGILLPGLAAMKALKAVNGLREAGSIGAWAKNSTALDVIMGNSAEMAASQRAITVEAETALYNQGVFAGRTVNSPAMKAAKLNLYGKKAVDAVRTTAAFEVGNFAAFNSSEMFYPSDTTVYDQAKWVGAGLGVGVGLELAAARYGMRQMIRAATNRMSSGAAADVFNLSPQQKFIDQVMFRPNERGVGVTAYAAMDADLNTIVKASDQSANLKTSIYQDQVNIKAVQTKQVGLMAYDPHEFIPRTQLTDGQMELALGALKVNPTSLLGATKLGQLPDSMPEFYASITKGMEQAKKDLETANIIASQATDPVKRNNILSEAAKKFAPIFDASTETHFVLEPTGGWTLFKNRAENWLDKNSFSQIKRVAYKTPDAKIEGGIKNSKLIAKADHEIIVHDNFRIETAFSNATPLDFSAMYATGAKMINEWKPVEGQTFILTPQVNWRTLEMTSALAKKKPEAMQQISLGAATEAETGFSSLDDVDFAVLNGKFKEFSKLSDQIERAAIAPKGSLLGRIGGVDKFTPAQILQRLNLPVPNGMESSPVLEMFAHARLQNMTDLEQMFPKPNGGRAFDQPYTQLDLVKKHLQETAGVDGPVALQGKLLEQVADTAPIFVAAKTLPELSIADANLQSRVMVMRDVHLERLASISPAQSPIVAGVLGKIFNASQPGGNLSESANVARAVQSLQDGVLSGTGQLVYQDRINAQFPALKAAQLIAQDGDKFIDNYVEMLAANTVTPKMAAILNPKNKSDLLDFNRIEQSYRHGWEILGSSGGPNAGRASGTHIFELDPDSKINRALKELHFPGEDPEAITHLPDMSVTALKNGYKPLEVSGPAGDLAHAISRLSIQSGIENNTLRTALGKHAIKNRSFHLPTPELNKEGTWFVYNPQGKVVNTYTGTNLSENERRAKDAATQLGQGHTAVPLETVKFDRQHNDDTFFDLIDFSDQLAKTGAGIKGGLAHTQIDTGPVTLQAMVRSLQEQFLHVGIRARAAIFEPELSYARQAADAATAVTRENAGRMNIYDRYIATMFSQTPQGKGLDKGIIGNTYRGIESSFDRALTWMYSHFSEVTAANESGKLGAGVLRSMLRARSSENEFRQFQKQLPSWSPFEDTAAWAESTFKEKSKINARAFSGELSKLSSTMSLRFLDVGTALQNFAGLFTNAHSVVYALRRLPGESRDEWLSRTGAYGSEYVDDIMTFNPSKALNQSIKAYWRGELTAPMEDAAKHGYFKPEYAALAKALTTPSKPHGKALEWFLENSVKLADNSEIMSRKIAWGLGYKIGKDLHKFKDENNAYIFANNFVNQMIGNYSPNNKPAMFQGAVGLPLGTFQTYMFNFYRRLYENIETGNKAAIMAQYAAQASIFGWRSVPGYGAWNSVFQSNRDGSDDFTGRVRRTFDPGVGDMLLNGSVSNIPKIWGGLQADGLAFYTRGSVDLVQPPPTLLEMSKAPPIQFLTETYGGIRATLKNVFSGSFSLQQQEEILANFSTNRAVKSIMELAADNKTSKSGDVVDAGTRDAIHVAAALLGTQPSSTRALQEAYSRQQSVKLAQADMRETLNAHTKALLRGGDFTTDDLQSVVQSYINAGGNPAYLGQWFRNELMMATQPRTQKQLESLARSGKLLEFQDMLATLQQNQDPKVAH